MKAAIATGFGDVNENIFCKENWPRPTLLDQDTSGWMVIRVLACALAPGDVRLLSGRTDYVQLPKGGHPYVIGSDVCGVVVEVENGEAHFRVGDRVVSRFGEPHPVGGAAEFRLVKTSLSERAPTGLSPAEACTLPASAMAAKLLATKFVRPGQRVLILGASGGVGTFLCQFVKLRGASYLAATSTATELVKELGCDCVIDYRTQNWWEIDEFHRDKFDVVLDLVNGDNWERGGRSGLAMKRNAKYVSLLTGVATDFELHGPMDMVKLVFRLMSRLLWTRVNPFRPNWYAPDGLELKPGDLRELFQDVEQGRIRVILDPSCPFPFTEEGARSAMALQKSTHAHGKVVIHIADE